MAVPQTANSTDITSVIANLSSRQNGRPKTKISGRKRAAILMLALGEQYGGKIWSMLDDDEVRQLSLEMSTLGTVEVETVEDMLLEFVSRMSASGALMGNFDATERLLQQYLPPERVNGIMDEIRGPAGRNMWEKLSNVQEEVLANYLKNEYPQTIAVVLSKLKPEHAARVLAILPEDMALDVINRMLKMEAVQKEVIERVEQTLRTEFMSNLSQTRRRDAHEVMAEIFNNFDRQTETRFITSLEEENRESAERIKALMFTFDDLVKLDSGSAQTLMRHVDKDKLGIALKSANEEVRGFFLGNMSSRAGKMLLDDMAALGPVRLRDVVAAPRKLCSQLVAAEPLGEITGLVSDCFSQLVSTPHLVVRINSSLYEAAREKIERLATQSGFQGRLLILAEPEIATGDCRIEWADGGVVQERAAIEARIDELVGRYMASQEQGT